MASFSLLASFIAVIVYSALSAECGTPTGSGSRTSRVPNSLRPKKPCLRRCRAENTAQQEKPKCVKDCGQEEASVVQGNKNDLASKRVRRQRSLKTTKNKCLGLDNDGRFPFHYPRPREILNVNCNASQEDHHYYNVSWEPVQETDLEEYNWTHYSLLYQFRNDHNVNDHEMKCVLVPMNTTYFVLKHAPLWSPGGVKPDILISAVVPYPFTKSIGSFETHEFDPLAPDYLSTFIPWLPTSRPIVSHFKIGVSITGGVIALLIVVLMALIWRKSRHCRYSHREPAILDNPPNTENTDHTSELYHCCYYPESEAFRSDVASVVNRFRSDGYNVIMDSMVSNKISSDGPMRWAETQIRTASKVLIFLSPGLLKLACGTCNGVQSQENEDINRVWFELDLLREFYVRTRSASKMVCITIPSAPVRSPHTRLLWAKVIYRFPQDHVKILRRLNERPSILPL